MGKYWRVSSCRRGCRRLCLLSEGVFQVVEMEVKLRVQRVDDDVRMTYLGAEEKKNISPSICNVLLKMEMLSISSERRFNV